MKQVHWQLPFASLNGTQYRIDIYSDADENENANWPIQLVGGAAPFVTDEDNSDDFFAPVRSQTGVISIVNTSGELSIYDILPADNTDKPVRVVRVNDGAVVWQGFLNAEAYSQGYNDRPQQIDLPVISMLEATKYENTYDDDMPVKLTVAHMIYEALSAVTIKAPYADSTKVYYPIESASIMDKYVETTRFADVEKTTINAYRQNSELKYKYAHDILSMICTFMGWILREDGENFIFSDPMSRNGYEVANLSDMDPHNGDQFPHTSVPGKMKSMSTLSYRGKNHNISVRNGARSVTVISKVDEFDMTMNLPEFPDGVNQTTGRVDVGPEAKTPDPSWRVTRPQLEVVATSQTDQYSHVSFGSLKADMRLAGLIPKRYNSLSQCSTEDVINHKYASDNSAYKELIAHRGTPDFFPYYAGAFWGATRRTEPEEFNKGINRYKKYNPGLYCVVFPGALEVGSGYDTLTSVRPIFSISSVKPYHLNGGYVNINAEYEVLCEGADNNFDFIPLSEFKERHFGKKDVKIYFDMHLEFSIGNMWWNGSGWTTTRSTFKARFGIDTLEHYSPDAPHYEAIPNEDEIKGAILYLNSIRQPGITEIGGEAVLKIWPGATDLHVIDGNDHLVYDLIEVKFSSIDVEYNVYTHKELNYSISDRSENEFYKLISKRFDEEVKIDTELCSDFNNKVAISAIYESDGSMVKTLPYTTGDMHPELHLLDKVYRYYSDARSIITLEVEHIDNGAPLPLTHILGYESTAKIYTPMSESRDWKTGVSTIQCFEVPE